MIGQWYLSSLLLVSFLLNEHADRFATYQRVLKQLPRDQQGAVWGRVFADYPPAQIERDILAWLRHGRLEVLTVALAPRAIEPTSLLLSDADVYSLRAVEYVKLGGGAKEAEAAAAARAAVSSDAAHIVGNVLLVALKLGAEAHGAEVIAAHPADHRAWMVRAATLDEGSERTEALRKMCELAESSPGSAAEGVCEK